MKRCRTVSGLVKAIEKGEQATLKIWDIMQNSFDEKGAYLNLGEGSYSYVGSENWLKIRNFLVDPNGEFYKNKSNFRYYFE